MRTLRYLVLALLVILVIVVIVGLFLPSKVRLERSIDINRDKQTIFKVINSLSNFNQWSPWYDYDVNAEYVISGAPSGIGSKLTWNGNEKVGTGSNEIIESELNSRIKTKFFFGKSDAPAFSTIILKQDETLTKVTNVIWAFENDFGYNVFYRYFGLVLEDMIAPDYERGLEKLKIHVESLPLYDYSNITIVDTQAEKTYAFSATTSIKSEEITPVIASSYGKIINFITSNNINMVGTPKIINLKFEEDIYQFLAAIPVSANELKDDKGEIQAYLTYQGKAVKFIHKGAYSNFKKSYEIIAAYLQQNNLENNGNSWEDFVSDPANTSEEDLITHIYQPIK